MDPKTMTRLFGTTDEKAITAQKAAAEKAERAIPAKVVRVPLSGEECKKLCQSVGVKYLEGYEQRVFRFTLTDGTVDRYGDIVRAEGGDLANYKKNPVVLAFHNGRALPVGASIRTYLDQADGDIKGYVLLYDERVDPTGMSDTIYRFVSNGAIKTGSIGFMPKENGTRPPSDDERKKLKMPRYGVIYEQWELLEFSITPVPANPSATMRDVKGGVYSVKAIEQARKAKLFDEAFLREAETLLADGAPVEGTVVADGPVADEPEEPNEKDDSMTLLINKLTLLVDSLNSCTKALLLTAENLRACDPGTPAEPPSATEESSGEKGGDELYGDVRDVLEQLAGKIKNL